MEDKVILGALALNLLISSGGLYKLIDFARNYGGLEMKVKTHGEEIEKLRAFSHDIRDGTVPIVMKARQ